MNKTRISPQLREYSSNYLYYGHFYGAEQNAVFSTLNTFKSLTRRGRCGWNLVRVVKLDPVLQDVWRGNKSSRTILHQSSTEG